MTTRNYFEINENTANLDGNKLTITIPTDQQSAVGCELYFNSEFAKQRRKWRMKKITISPNPLNSYWNWFTTATGNSRYEMEVESPINIGKYRASGIPGGFGFSGTSDSDITITVEMVD